MAKSIAKSNVTVIFGSAAQNLIEAFKYIFKGQIEWQQLRHQMVSMSFDNLPMILALTSLGSMILALNITIELQNWGGRDLLGPLVTNANLRELLPIFIAFAIGARTGTSMTAEISSMVVTEQIDVLRLFKTSPVYFLLVPRLLAGILISPLLLGIAAVVSIYAGMLVTNIVGDLEFNEFLSTAWKYVTMKEYWSPLIKLEIFMVYSVLINVTMGLGTLGGAKEVGEATNKATAIVMIGIIILDGILTPLLYS